MNGLEKTVLVTGTTLAVLPLVSETASAEGFRSLDSLTQDSSENSNSNSNNNNNNNSAREQTEIKPEADSEAKPEEKPAEEIETESATRTETTGNIGVSAGYNEERYSTALNGSFYTVPTDHFVIGGYSLFGFQRNDQVSDSLLMPTEQIFGELALRLGGRWDIGGHDSILTGLFGLRWMQIKDQEDKKNALVDDIGLLLGLDWSIGNNLKIEGIYTRSFEDLFGGNEIDTVTAGLQFGFDFEENANLGLMGSAKYSSIWMPKDGERPHRYFIDLSVGPRIRTNDESFFGALLLRLQNGEYTNNLGETLNRFGKPSDEQWGIGPEIYFELRPDPSFAIFLRTSYDLEHENLSAYLGIEYVFGKGFAYRGSEYISPGIAGTPAIGGGQGGSGGVQ